MSTGLKRTPLYDAHRRANARLIEFGGWEMPVQYSGIADEHLAVRKAGGVFDISHMGEVSVSGPGAVPFLNHTLTNDIRKLAVGQAQYSLMCNERGGVIDDLYVYRRADDDFLLIINASRIDDDVKWLEKRAAGFQQHGLSLRNISDSTGALAIQGPNVTKFIHEIFAGPSVAGTKVASVTELKKNEIGQWHFNDQQVWVARTGYTGEDGFEAVAPAGVIEALWEKVLQTGAAHGLKPAGLGARDTLRTEVCYPLYGHELDDATTPLEAGLGFFVALAKEDFMGRAVMLAQKEVGVSRKLVAFRMAERSAPPRPDYPIWSAGEGGELVGKVASGTQSPSLGAGIGLGYVKTAFAKTDTTIAIEIRGRRFPATIVPKPIYRKPN
jgi:aminomethyltransferase